MFLTAEQWFTRLEEIAQRYNGERQGGRLLNDLSPDEAFTLFDDPANPPPEFDARTRYLLAHHKRPVRVTKRGITVFGNRYYGSEIGHLIGRELLAWYDPDAPEILSLTDMERKNPIAIPRAENVPAINGGDVLASELQRADGHLSYAKTRYGVLAAIHRKHRGQIIPTREQVDLGRELGRVQTAVVDTQQRVGKARRVAREMGMQISDEAAARPEAAEELRELQALLSERNAKGDAP
jgi:hypothetical protein